MLGGEGQSLGCSEEDSCGQVVLIRLSLCRFEGASCGQVVLICLPLCPKVWLFSTASSFLLLRVERLINLGCGDGASVPADPSIFLFVARRVEYFFESKLDRRFNNCFHGDICWVSRRGTQIYGRCWVPFVVHCWCPNFVLICLRGGRGMFLLHWQADASLVLFA